MFRADLHLLHVLVDPVPIPAPDGAWIRPEDCIPRLLNQARLDLATNLADAKLRFGGQPVTAVEVGSPVEQILQYADDKNIDLIVVGTQGHRGLSRLILGSVAEKLVRLAKCPVLTVHADQSEIR
jgi:nucleotide-binding universal stress UspA family protein